VVAPRPLLRKDERVVVVIRPMTHLERGTHQRRTGLIRFDGD
jgi:hypothetical protein